MLLLPRIALGVDAPVLASQTSHDAHRTELIAERSVEGVLVLVVYEAVEVLAVLFSCCAVKRSIVYVRFLRRVLP